jgi:hypothetical protein
LGLSCLFLSTHPQLHMPQKLEAFPSGSCWPGTHHIQHRLWGPRLHCSLSGKLILSPLALFSAMSHSSAQVPFLHNLKYHLPWAIFVYFGSQLYSFLNCFLTTSDTQLETICCSSQYLVLAEHACEVSVNENNLMQTVNHRWLWAPKNWLNWLILIIFTFEYMW